MLEIISIALCCVLFVYFFIPKKEAKDKEYKEGLRVAKKLFIKEMDKDYIREVLQKSSLTNDQIENILDEAEYYALCFDQRKIAHTSNGEFRLLLVLLLPLLCLIKTLRIVVTF